MSISKVRDYLSSQEIFVSPAEVLPSFFDPQNEINGREVAWSSLARQTDQQQSLTGLLAESMGLASMAAVSQIDLEDGHKLLDTCAAPGMKSLYASKTADIELFSNDLSADRIARMLRLFSKHNVTSQVTKQDAARLGETYQPASFDRILIDAPCSGEGLILCGNEKQAVAWSSAKVKRLQQLQIKILKSAWKLLKPEGRLVYATCTLNKNENERVIHKALHIDVSVEQSPLSLERLPKLQPGSAWRVEPSQNSIGFFMAVLEKPVDLQD